MNITAKCIIMTLISVRGGIITDRNKMMKVLIGLA